jgi:hypothetical protein
MKNYSEFNGMWFTNETPEAIKIALVNGYRSNYRFRLWYGNAESGKSWNEENDICGYIDKSNGSVKIPLLLANNTSSGGGGIMTDCIVKIYNITLKKVVYVHPTFNQSKFEAVNGSDMESYAANVLQDGDVYARCKSFQKAVNLARFMNGERMCK